jgi:hypothetical protein
MHIPLLLHAMYGKPAWGYVRSKLHDFDDRGLAQPLHHHRFLAKAQHAPLRRHVQRILQHRAMLVTAARDRAAQRQVSNQCFSSLALVLSAPTNGEPIRCLR